MKLKRIKECFKLQYLNFLYKVERDLFLYKHTCTCFPHMKICCTWCKKINCNNCFCLKNQDTCNKKIHLFDHHSRKMDKNIIKRSQTNLISEKMLRLICIWTTCTMYSFYTGKIMTSIRSTFLKYDSLKCHTCRHLIKINERIQMYSLIIHTQSKLLISSRTLWTWSFNSQSSSCFWNILCCTFFKCFPIIAYSVK